MKRNKEPFTLHQQKLSSGKAVRHIEHDILAQKPVRSAALNRKR